MAFDEPSSDRHHLGVNVSSASSSGTGHNGYDQFDTSELSAVLSHYDLGVIESIKAFPHGSRRAPKMLIRAKHGTYLLKRRAAGKNDPFKVAFSHQLQMYLARKQFPLPRLVGTTTDNNSMVQWNVAMYELFEFVKGERCDESPAAAAEAGKTLGRFHTLLRSFRSDYESATGTYHGSSTVETAMRVIPRTIARTGDQSGENTEATANRVAQLQRRYHQATERVDALGLHNWPVQIAHCDWHPGNTLYRDRRIVAVIDFDAARMSQRVIDVANGALQFSIMGRGTEPGNWPESIDLLRFKRFVREYEAVPECVLTRAEIESIPWLMIEALIAESAMPIANYGAFGQIPGTIFLRIVEQKVQWLKQHAAKLTSALQA